MRECNLVAMLVVLTADWLVVQMESKMVEKMDWKMVEKMAVLKEWSWVDLMDAMLVVL